MLKKLCFLFLVSILSGNCTSMQPMYITDKKPANDEGLYTPLQTRTLMTDRPMSEIKIALITALGENKFSTRFHRSPAPGNFELVTEFELNKVDLDNYTRGWIGSLSFFFAITLFDGKILLDVKYCIAYGGLREPDWRRECLCEPAVEPQVEEILDGILEIFKNEIK